MQREIQKKKEDAKKEGRAIPVQPERKRRRWDVGAEYPAKKSKSEWDIDTPMPGQAQSASRWDTPTPGRGDFTPGGVTPGGTAALAGLLLLFIPDLPLILQSSLPRVSFSSHSP